MRTTFSDNINVTSERTTTTVTSNIYKIKHKVNCGVAKEPTYHKTTICDEKCVGTRPARVASEMALRSVPATDKTNHFLSSRPPVRKHTKKGNI